MNDNIGISVVIPVYNSEKELCRCVDSIINQTYKKLEIILIDDGSTDASGSICDAYVRKHENIRVIHKENEGQAIARKTGIEFAGGDYITFVDSDDYIDANAYEKILSLIDTDILPEMIVYNLVEEYVDCSCEKKNHFKEGVYNRSAIETKILPQVLSFGKFFHFGVLPNLVCKMVRRDYVQNKQLEISDSVRFGEDADMVFQWLLFLNTIQIIDYAPYHYNKREDSMMKRDVEYKEIMLLKEDLKKAFLKSEWKEDLLKQLEDYITFVLLLKLPKTILGKWLCKDGKKVALYGAGGFGQAVYKAYNSSIAMWVDINFEYYSNKGFPISTVADLLEHHERYDAIYIAITDTELCEEIRNRLLRYGVKKGIYYFDKKNIEGYEEKYGRA